MKTQAAITLLLGLAGFALADGDFLVVQKNADGTQEPAAIGDEVMAPIQAPSLGKQVIDQIHEAPKRRGSWFAQVGGGYAFGASGDFTHAFDTTLDKNAFGGHGYYASAWMRSVSFDDIYGDAHTFSARLGRALGRNRVYLRLAYTEASGSNIHLGEIDNCDLYGRFEDYSDWGVLVGFDRHFNERGRFSPYIGLEAGVRFVDGIAVDFSSTDGHHTHDFAGVPFYNGGAIFTAELVVGVDFDVTNSFVIGVESGLRYQAGLGEDDGGLSSFGLEDLNNADGEMLLVPVMLTGTVNF